MARTDERFREAYNALLNICTSKRKGESLSSEAELSKILNVSRTVVRSALTRLSEVGIIYWSGRDKRVVREPNEGDFIELNPETLRGDELERQFLNWILRFDVPPGTPLNVSELCRQFNVPPHALHEFLASLSRFGLVERRQRGGWRLLGFTRDYAMELFELRTMIELNAISRLVKLPQDDPIWPRLDDLKRQHHELAEQIDERYNDFSVLDERFHATIFRANHNRFIAELQRVIALVFYYHYQWDKRDERERNEAAIQEHLELISAIQSRDESAALTAARNHLNTSKKTLLLSLKIHNHE